MPGYGTLVAMVLRYLVAAYGRRAWKRLLYVLLEGVTLGTLTQPRLHPVAGYLAFATLVLFLIGLAILPTRSRSMALIKSDE